PGRRSFEKANAASDEVTVPTTVTVRETITLLRMPDSSGPASQMRAELDHTKGTGSHCGGSSNTPSMVFSDVEIIHTSGASIRTEPRRSRITTRVLVRRYEL